MTTPNTASRGELVFYQAPDGSVKMDVRLERESLWLSLNQMAELFERDKSVVSRHLRNVFKEGELGRESVVAKNATTATDGKTYQVEFFNLDAIISVGYRVNSKRGTQFRIWATSVLRDHVLKGYSVNQNRLRDLNQAVRLIADVVERKDLSGDEATALLRVVGEYSRALDLLDDYDHQRVRVPDASGKTVHMMSYEGSPAYRRPIERTLRRVRPVRRGKGQERRKRFGRGHANLRRQGRLSEP